jgi:uncharacterized linocin/CFP29 family protein
LKGGGNMDFLKRSLAPITEKAWEELEGRSREIFKNKLKMRKVVDIEGPYGWEYSSYNLGSNELVDNPKDGLGWGIRKSLPLIESRNTFVLKQWELDNIERGSQTPDLEGLETSAKQFANFEDNIILKGLERANIVGLQKLAKENLVKSSKSDLKAFIKSVSESKKRFMEQGIEGPYTLLINREIWEELFSQNLSYPLDKLIVQIIDTTVMPIHNLEQSFFISNRGGDFKLILGQDISLGYQDKYEEDLKFFYTETFTFHVVTPEAITGLEL